jgi:uncharacterized protein involved in exopolysaccharide biosynthesis
MLRHRHLTPARARRLRRLLSVLILLVTVVGAVLVGQLVYRISPHSYAASSSMLVSSQPDVIAAIIAGGARNLAGAAASTDALVSPPTRGGLGSLWAILTSREMLLRIARKHNLTGELGLDESDAVEALGDMTTFTQITDVGVSVTVTCQGSQWAARTSLAASPLTLERARTLCAELPNSYLTELENYITETNMRQARQMREFLETSKQETEQQLESSHTFLDPQNKAAQLLERLKTVEPRYAEAGARADEVAEMLQTARGQIDELAVMRIAQEVMARNPVIATLEERLAELQVEVSAQQAKGKTEQHREIVQISTAIASTRQQLLEVKEEVRQQVSLQTNPAYDAAVTKVVDLETELVGAQARKAHYARLRQEVKADLAELPAVARAYVSLQRQQEQQTGLLEPLAQGLSLVGLIEKYSRASRFLRLDTAVPPQRPTSSPLLLSLVVSLVVLLVGVLALIAYLRGRFGLLGT